MELNRKSQWMVDNLFNGFKRFNPNDTFVKYMEGDVACIKWDKNNTLHRIYKFYADSSGDICLLTVHGNMMGEYNAVSKTKVAFGLPVTQIRLKEDSMGQYVEFVIGGY